MTHRVRMFLLQVVADQLDDEGKVAGQITSDPLPIFEADFNKLPEFMAYLRSQRGLDKLLTAPPPPPPN